MYKRQIDFHYKEDNIPGQTNQMSFTAGEAGQTLRGKCAELCGEYHSLMLFNVELVSPEEYDAYLESLEQQGFVGPIDDSINPVPGIDAVPGEEGEGH